MAKQPEELNIKSRARRRLIGAIALALAVVVILPMVLDSEPKTTGQDIDMRIPAPDKVGEFVPGVALSEVIEAATLAESAVVPASGVTVENAAAAEKSETQPEVKTQTITDKQTDAGQAGGNKSEAKKSEVKPTEAKSPEAKKPETKPAEAKKSEAKKSEVKLAEAKQAEARPVSAGTYIVQVGAFSNAVTATQEAGKLKALGFKAYTELVSGTTRVRVGPYVDRNKADEVRRLLEKHGLHPVVTEVR
jgi:DedD protein